MSTTTVVATTTPRTRPFLLKVGDYDVTEQVPVGDDNVPPPRITESIDSANSFDFTIEDVTGRLRFQLGEEVWLRDRRNGIQTLFGGHLINIRTVRRPGRGVLLHCSAIGWEVWLDWRVIISWSTRPGRDNTQIRSDREAVQRLVNKATGNYVKTPDETVDRTQYPDATHEGLDFVRIRKKTLREGLERIAEAATAIADRPTRRFYVDNDRRLHWFRETEFRDAPYRISDGSYTRHLMDTSGLVALWTFSGSGSTAYDALGTYHMTLAGGYQRGLPGYIDNEPQLQATRFDGSTGYGSVSGAALHPGDTFTLMFTVRRLRTGQQDVVWAAGTNDIFIEFQANDTLKIVKQAVGNNWLSTQTFRSTSRVYHVAFARSPGSTTVYVDGDDITSAGTTTARTYSAAAGAISIGRSGSVYGNLDLQHLALFDRKLSAAEVRAAYYQSGAITPEDFEVERDAMSGRELVYVSGANAKGSGWVRPDRSTPRNTRFGKDGVPNRHEVIEREDSENEGQRDARAENFLQRYSDPQVSGRFSITGRDGWHVGQYVYLTNSAHSLDAYGVEISEVVTDVLFGNGVLRYDITFGKNRYLGSRVWVRGLPKKR